MVDKLASTKTSKYHTLRSVVFGILVAILAWELVISPGLDWWNAREIKPESDETLQLQQAESDLAVESLPIKLSVPAINLTADFTNPLGISDSGEIEVPKEYDKVGWYKYSPSPGQIGPMIILGHVDSFTGPAVFFSIGQLKEGDEIQVTGDDGIERSYVVERSMKYEQADFPAEEVYGNTTGPELRLITCSGIFDKTNQRYSHNRVVYAKLVSNNSEE